MAEKKEKKLIKYICRPSNVQKNLAKGYKVTEKMGDGNLLMTKEI